MSKWIWENGRHDNAECRMQNEGWGRVQSPKSNVQCRSNGGNLAPGRVQVGDPAGCQPALHRRLFTKWPGYSYDHDCPIAVGNGERYKNYDNSTNLTSAFKHSAIANRNSKDRMDSLAPARSALAGLWLRPHSFRRFPRGSSHKICNVRTFRHVGISRISGVFWMAWLRRGHFFLAKWHCDRQKVRFYF
jgi:hypothetical protein